MQPSIHDTTITTKLRRTREEAERVSTTTISAPPELMQRIRIRCAERGIKLWMAYEEMAEQWLGAGSAK